MIEPNEAIMHVAFKIRMLIPIALCGAALNLLFIFQMARLQNDPLNLLFLGRLEPGQYRNLLALAASIFLVPYFFLFLQLPGDKHVRRRLSDKVARLLLLDYSAATFLGVLSVSCLLWLLRNSVYEVSPLESLIPWMNALAFLTYVPLITYGLLGGRKAFIALRRSSHEFFHSVLESRRVLPVLLAGFLFTIFSKDVTEAVAYIHPVSLGIFVTTAIVLSTKFEGSLLEVVQRIAGMTTAFIIISIGVLAINMLLVSNKVLIEWGSPSWVSCLRTDGLTQTCTEALIVPRLKLAVLLGAVGTLSTMASSLVPPRRIPS
jgi:hypothetical protein